MTKKQFFSVLIIIFLPFILSGCFKKEVPISQGENGSYVYTAKDLGFGLTLPKEFQYFQTQRQNKGDYTDLQIFVPTSDTDFPQIVPGYAEVVTIRVVTNKEHQPERAFELIGSAEDRSHYILFWNNIPKDWKEKWTDAMKKQIIDSFKKIS
ncbi:hypothetical protein HGA34_05055 [Candidatus Falkowbacteria bacterium]|nr:hypothetical protein [Candidatus Falkowbacteria bacterium]